MTDKRWIKIEGLKTRDLTNEEKNKMVHTCIIGNKLQVPIPDYVGRYEAAMQAVQKVAFLDDEIQRLFYKDLPPLHDVTPEELCWHVIKAFGYSF